MSERKQINYADYAFGGNIALKENLKDELGGGSDSKTLSFLGRGVGEMVGRFYTMDSAVDLVADRDSGKNTALSPQFCRISIGRKVNIGRSDTYSDYIATANPPEKFSEWKGELSWAEWLAKPRLRGGPTKSQFNEVLQWNLDAMIAENKSRTEELAQVKTDYLTNLEQAVEERRLPRTLLRKAQSVLPESQLLIADPMNQQTGRNTAHRKANVVMLTRDYTPIDVVHEQTHLLGGFKGRFLNEVATEMISGEILPDRAFNTGRLHKLVEQRTGERKLEQLDGRFRELKQYWLPRVVLDQSVAIYISSVMLLKEQEPEMSYSDLIRRDLPTLSDEEVAVVPDMIDTFYGKPLRKVITTVFSRKSSSKE